MSRKHHADDHYRKLAPQPIEIIESLCLGYKCGNIVKYIARAEFKGQRLDDYKKALEYLKMLKTHTLEYRSYIDDYLCSYTVPYELPKWNLDPKLNIVLEAIFNPSWDKLDIAIQTMEEWVKAL